MTQTVTSLFDTMDDAKRAVRDLEAAGVPHDAISLVANDAHGEHAKAHEMAGAAGGEAVKGAEGGAVVGGVGGLLAGLGLLAIPGLGPVVAAGWLAATVVGAVGGAAVGAAAGGLVGALTKHGVPEHEAHIYAEGVRRGGALVSARVDDAHVATATRILKSERAVDIAQRREAYVGEGWSKFDESAPVYTPEQVAAERARAGFVSPPAI